MSEPDGQGVRTVLEVMELDGIEGRYHPSVATHIIPAPSAAVVGSTKSGQAWSHPEPVAEPPSAPSLIRVPVPHFKMRFTPEERVAIKDAAQQSPYVADWLEIMDDPRLEYVEIGDPNLQAAMQMLVSANLLTADRAVLILS